MVLRTPGGASQRDDRAAGEGGGARHASAAADPAVHDWINAGKRPDVYAHNLYNHLRTLDRAGCARIFVQALPQDERWAAILDRLQRASGMGDDSLELSVS